MGEMPRGRAGETVRDSPERGRAGAARRDSRWHRSRTVQVRVGAYQLSKRGATRFDFRDPYHLAAGLSWPLFFASLLTIYVGINLAFALLYLAVPGAIANAHPGSFGDAFFFSVETLATVGYGVMAPASLYGHVISSLEIYCGLAFTAIATGLTFVRFSRPKAKILFAEQAVIASHNGQPTLMIRIGNGRLTMLTDAVCFLTVMLDERTAEGLEFRRSHDLPVVRSRLPIFGLTWTIMHEIGPSSPLAGYSPTRLAAEDARLFLSVTARDPTLAADVHAIRDYGHEDILFGTRYGDAVVTDERGRTLADMTRISLVEAEPQSFAPMPASE